jgi:hypothetical protein
MIYNSSHYITSIQVEGEFNDSSTDDANRHHFNEMISNGIIYFAGLYLVLLTNLKVWKGLKHEDPTFFFGQNVLF